MPVHRLFVGIDPPPAIKGELLALMEGVSGARWQTAEQLHLTVRFVGEVDGRQAEDIVAALSALRHPGFAARLEGVGVFDRRGRPESLWVGAQPQTALRALHDKADRAVQMAGVPPEGRAYLPHVTIARLNGGAGPIDGFAATHGGFRSTPFRVEALTLYESHLGRTGAFYEAVERWPLG